MFHSPDSFRTIRKLNVKMACLCFLLLAVVFAVSDVMSHTVEIRGASPTLSADQIKQLTDRYGLMQAPFGNFLFGILYHSAQTTTLSTGVTALAGSYLIVVNNGVCEDWLVFPETDRLYTWVDGKATIDLARPDGVIESVCLGNTLKDKNCVYSLTVPANTKSDIKTDGYIVFTGTTINGAVSDGRQVDTAQMEKEYGEKYGELIKEVAKCG